MQRAGLDTEKLMLCQPDSGEMALEVVDQTVRSNAVDIICVDSVAALVPRAEIEGEMGAHQGELHHMLHPYFQARMSDESHQLLAPHPRL